MKVQKMKASIFCMAILFFAQTDAKAAGKFLLDISGLNDFDITDDWYVENNYCVSQFNEDLNAVPETSPDGNESIEKCKSKCFELGSSRCSAIEWYKDGWNGTKCFLVLDYIPAVKGSDGPRRGDATCHIGPDCKSNNECPADRPICRALGQWKNGYREHGGKCVLNGQSPNVQGCWIRFPSGCPNQKNKSKYKNLQDARIWNRETYNGASNSRDKCSARRGPINNWCGVSNVITHYVSEPCQPRDSDICLKKAWKDDDWTLGCKKTFEYESDWCDTWAKDMRRCCPESCKSGTFRKDDCVILSPCHTNGCDGCYHPKYDVCLRFGNRFRELIFKNEEDCTSKGGINCREHCLDHDSCKFFNGRFQYACERKGKLLGGNSHGRCREHKPWYWFWG